MASNILENQNGHAECQLHQVMRDDLAVEIEHLLDGRVEPRQQHVVDDEDGQGVSLVGPFQSKLPLEALDPVLLLAFVGPVPPGFGIVVITREHRCDLKPPELR